MESIGLRYYSPIHFWHPSRIRFLAPTRLRSPNRRKSMESICFLLLQSYTFLALLSDPIFGSEMAPEPTREENHGIYTFFVIKILFISGTPLGSYFWLRKSPGAQTGGKSWNRQVFCMKVLNVFGIAIPYFSGTPLGSDFWLRNSFGAQTGGKSWNR